MGRRAGPRAQPTMGAASLLPRFLLLILALGATARRQVGEGNEPDGDDDEGYGLGRVPFGNKGGTKAASPPPPGARRQSALDPVFLDSSTTPFKWRAASGDSRSRHKRQRIVTWSQPPLLLPQAACDVSRRIGDLRCVRILPCVHKRPTQLIGALRRTRRPPCGGPQWRRPASFAAIIGAPR